jgi:hypothetical protein
MNVGDQILERNGDGGYTAHRLSSGTPMVESWSTFCGAIPRWRAMLAHPLLPAWVCLKCYPDGKRPVIRVRGIEKG